jgi:hypothetical protein
MKAIVATDRAAGTAGVKLMERPDPQAAINDVVVHVHASPTLLSNRLAASMTESAECKPREAWHLGRLWRDFENHATTLTAVVTCKNAA